MRRRRKLSAEQLRLRAKKRARRKESESHLQLFVLPGWKKPHIKHFSNKPIEWYGKGIQGYFGKITQ